MKAQLTFEPEVILKIVKLKEKTVALGNITFLKTCTSMQVCSCVQVPNHVMAQFNITASMVSREGE